MNNNVIVNCDTDSIMIAKPDGAPWSKKEQQTFLDALNVEFPEKIKFAHDGYYDAVGVFGSKNYALLLNKEFCKPKDLDKDGNPKIKTKGSALRDQKKEPALREMMDKMIAAMIYDKQDTLLDIYNSYVKEAMNVKEIRRWCSKKTITEAVLDCQKPTSDTRKNEMVVWNAVKNEPGIQMGDKCYTYPVILGYNTESSRVGKTGKPLKDKITEITGLKLDKYWTNDQDCDKLIERVYATVSIFSAVLDMDKFIDYSKAKNKKFLETL